MLEPHSIHLFPANIHPAKFEHAVLNTRTQNMKSLHTNTHGSVLPSHWALISGYYSNNTTSTYTKHVKHLKTECVTHLHEVANHPYSSSMVERDRVPLHFECCRPERSCVHICRRLLFSGRVQHCVDSNTREAVFHLKWSVSVCLSTYLLCSSLSVLFSPITSMNKLVHICTYIYIIIFTAHIMPVRHFVPHKTPPTYINRGTTYVTSPVLVDSYYKCF
jgi:hypothetical protein